MSKIPPLYATIAACVFAVCATVAAVFVPTERWEKLGHFLTDPATATAVGALGLAFLAIYTRARNLPPALVLVLALGASTLGCGAQLTAAQREALAAETQRCLANERAIVDRPGTTEEQDRANLATERERCDAARAAIVGGE